MDTKKQLWKQLTDSAANIPYTYSAHWIIVNRLKRRFAKIKVCQIILTAISTGGFLASIIAGIPWLSWVGGLTSAMTLGLNLYMLNFNIPDSINSHTNAANELWEIREAYKSLLIDFDDLEVEEIRTRRDKLTKAISRINKEYPGTDEKSFAQAQRDMPKYTFEDGEAERLLHIEPSSQHEK